MVYLQNSVGKDKVLIFIIHTWIYLNKFDVEDYKLSDSLY